MPMKKKVTLRHIAESLGLTVHTVSKALRGLPGMSEDTRKAVIAKARELGYRTKAQEEGVFAERIPRIVGKPRRFAMLLLSGDERHFHHPQFEGAQQRLGELGHTLHPLLLPRSLSTAAELQRWLEQNAVLYTEGLFLTAGLPEWIESALLALPLPKVVINYPPFGAAVDSVIWDVEHAVYQSVELLHRRGHRSILYVGDTEPHRGYRLRWKAFLAAAERFGLAGDDGGHLTRGAGDRAAWMEALRERLASGRYTAVLSAIPGNAEWVSAAAASVRIRIPEEMSLIAIEHEESPYGPDLTRPLLPVRKAGERAAELMLRRLANPALPWEHVRLLGPLHEGQTVRTPPNGGAGGLRDNRHPNKDR